jgi:hypothetical protein
MVTGRGSNQTTVIQLQDSCHNRYTIAFSKKKSTQLEDKHIYRKQESTLATSIQNFEPIDQIYSARVSKYIIRTKGRPVLFAA